jgi:hypothetical protein
LDLKLAGVVLVLPGLSSGESQPESETSTREMGSEDEERLGLPAVP